MSSRFGFKTNHFGISEEELEYDENDPSWWDTSPGMNALSGRYDSAKPFIERLQREEMAYLEKMVEERRARREIIRQEVFRDFSEKLKQHMAKLRPKPQPPLILEKIMSAREQQVPTTKVLSKYDDSETETGIHRFSDEINLPPPSSAVKSIVSKEDIPVVDIPAASTSTETSLTLDQAAVPKTTAIAASTHSMVTHKQESGISFPCSLSLQQSSTLESMKIGHAALTRTDSISSSRTVASRNSSWPLQQIVEEGRGEVSHGTGSIIRGGPEARASSGVHPDSNEDAKGDGSTASSALIKEKSEDISEIRKQSRHLSLYDEEIAFTKDFVAKTVALSDPIKNELKCTIKEKVSVSSKKFAKKSDIALIVRFFSSLLSGLTVYGFNDKMINLKDDEVAVNWAMAHIIDTYLNLIPQDISLLKVIVAVLSSLASTSSTFAKLLRGKLFIASPLLAVSHNECIKRISDLKKRSERFAETLAAWNARETAMMRLYIAFQALDFKLDTTVKGNDGMGELWKVIVVAISKETPFGAAVVSEILKQCWKQMHELYGRQMEKLLILINEDVRPHWNALNEKEENEIIRSVAEQYLISLKFTVDDCLCSFRT